MIRTEGEGDEGEVQRVFSACNSRAVASVPGLLTEVG